MLFTHPRSILDHLANGVCALVIGGFFAFIGLNAVSGCGQVNGACIHVHDLVGTPAATPAQVALAAR